MTLAREPDALDLAMWRGAQNLWLDVNRDFHETVIREYVEELFAAQEAQQAAELRDAEVVSVAAAILAAR